MNPSDRFTVLKSLKQSVFGEVLLCRDSLNDTVVVCKRSSQRTLAAICDTHEDPVKERHILKTILKIKGSEEVVINLQDTADDANYLWTVFELADEGDLFDCVSLGRSGVIAHRRSLFHFMANAVSFLHRHGVAHRDISPENFFLFSDGKIKLGDFGMAMESDGSLVRDDPAKGRVGKKSYRAPEVDESVAYNPLSADVFSLGVTLFILLTGLPPFRAACSTDRNWAFLLREGGADHPTHLEQRLKALLEYYQRPAIDPSAMALLAGMLAVLPGQRLTIEQVMAHPWVAITSAGNVAGADIGDAQSDSNSDSEKSESDNREHSERDKDDPDADDAGKSQVNSDEDTEKSGGDGDNK